MKNLRGLRALITVASATALIAAPAMSASADPGDFMIHIASATCGTAGEFDSPNLTIGELKSHLCTADYKKQLLLNGKVLSNNDQTLAEAGLANESTVTVGKLEGGLKLTIYKNVPLLPDFNNPNYQVCKGPGVWTTAASISGDFDAPASGNTVFGCNHDNVLVHFSGYIAFPQNRTVVFSNASDDGFELFLDGQNYIDDWHTHGTQGVESQMIEFQAGVAKKIDVWYTQGGGGANLAFGTADENYCPNYCNVSAAYFNQTPYFNFDAAPTARGNADVEIRDFAFSGFQGLTNGQKSALDGFIAAHPNASKVLVYGRNHWRTYWGPHFYTGSRISAVVRYLQAHGLRNATYQKVTSSQPRQTEGLDDTVSVTALANN